MKLENKHSHHRVGFLALVCIVVWVAGCDRAESWEARRNQLVPSRSRHSVRMPTVHNRRALVTASMSQQSPAPPTPIRLEAEKVPEPEHDRSAASSLGAEVAKPSYPSAEAAYRDKNWERATQLYRNRTERSPNLGWNHYMLGLSAWRAGLLAESQSAFARVLELDPSHTKSMLNLSRVLLEDGRPHNALRYVESVLANNPRSSVAYRVLGEVHEALGSDQRAINSYRKALALHDQDVWAMNRLGMVLSREGRHQEALPPLARAVELRRDVASLQIDLGLALERAGHYYSAGSRYKAALAIDRTNEVAALGVARVKQLNEPPGPRWVDLGMLAKKFVDGLEEERSALATENASGPEQNVSGPEGAVADGDRSQDTESVSQGGS